MAEENKEVQLKRELHFDQSQSNDVPLEKETTISYGERMRQKLQDRLNEVPDSIFASIIAYISNSG